MEQEIWDLMNNLLKEDNIINGNQSAWAYRKEILLNLLVS